MTATTVALRRAVARLTDRVQDLERRLDAGEDLWHELAEATAALAQAVRALHEGGDLLTTAELAEKYHLGRKTAARRGRAGELPGITPVRVPRLRWRSA